MKIPRCDTCFWWAAIYDSDFIQHNFCIKSTSEYNMEQTEPDNVCVLWEVEE